MGRPQRALPRSLTLADRPPDPVYSGHALTAATQRKEAVRDCCRSDYSMSLPEAAASQKADVPQARRLRALNLSSHSNASAIATSLQSRPARVVSRREANVPAGWPAHDSKRNQAWRSGYKSDAAKAREATRELCGTVLAGGQLATKSDVLKTSKPIVQTKFSPPSIIDEP